MSTARFDCQGFLVRPAVIDAATVARLRDAVDAMQHRPHELPPHERCCPGGATSVMIDHPAVLGVLHEILGPEVRCEAAGHRCPCPPSPQTQTHITHTHSRTTTNTTHTGTHMQPRTATDTHARKPTTHTRTHTHELQLPGTL